MGLKSYTLSIYRIKFKGCRGSKILTILTTYFNDGLKRLIVKDNKNSLDSD